MDAETAALVGVQDRAAAKVGAWLEEIPSAAEFTGPLRENAEKQHALLMALGRLPEIQEAFDRLLSATVRERERLQGDLIDALAGGRRKLAREMWDAWEAAAFDYREGASEDGVREDFNTWLRGKWKPDVPTDPRPLVCPQCRGGLQVVLELEGDEGPGLTVPVDPGEPRLLIYCPEPGCDKGWVEPAELVPR